MILIKQPEAVDVWLSQVIEDFSTYEATIAVATINATFAALLAGLDIDVTGRLHGFDASLIRHLWKHHSDLSELDRGQEPVTLVEIRDLHKLIELGVSQRPEKRFQHKNKTRIQTTIQNNGRLWTIVSEIRRRLIVPVTAWKKI
jgi:hypothetical protein